MSEWTLHHGECLEGMATLADRSVDHVITDPPYSEHVHSCQRAGSSLAGNPHNGKGRSAAPIARDRDLGFAHINQGEIQIAAHHFARLARRWILVFSDTESSHLWREELERFGAEYIRTCFWHKINGAPQFTGDRPAVACEAITVCHPPGKKHWSGGGRQGFYASPIAADRPGGEVRVHPTQKPLELMEALIRDFTDPGDLILDPFAGSGTTGVAAIRNGRRFIGWERDAKFHAVASRRLAGAREQLTLAVGP